MPAGFGENLARVSNQLNNDTWLTDSEIDIVNDKSPKRLRFAHLLATLAPYRVNDDTDQSYVLELNAAGGGWFAMERSFELRNHKNVPDEVEDAATLKDDQKVNADACGPDRLMPTS
ncbi:hypothetical protein FS837_010226, partial [Tulasnella sp. UAMH 9824]